MSNNAHPSPARPSTFFDSDEKARRIVEAVSRQALEILNGFRPPTSLSKVLVPQEQESFAKRVSCVNAYRRNAGIKVAPRVSVGGVHICRVNDEVIEANSVVRDSLRARFVCMRWEKKRSGWKITALELG
ncbi:Rv3235 family protein [Dermabacter sp. p3-SID358]|uniref:Rv3235 family protein n=1 Tax=Dermabacter sp. p3-SID358 TaxID=2916114 RepID=UPI0021A3AF98|nr:Rv3235 family protein [Dermabacter sp. p3-SID358]MCT1866733.1 Rv3235 family protein [Dermabacter sp. p3-SID358]